MAKAARKLALGPGNWCTLPDLENLKRPGFPSEWRTINKTAKAAKLRVVQQIFPDLQMLFIELQSLHAGNARRPFGPWHSQSFVATLRNNVIDLNTMGISMSQIEAIRSPKDFQTLTCEFIVRKGNSYNLEHRLRSKLLRWNLRILPGHIAPRALRALATMASTCKPRVLSMFWRTLFHGWPTTPACGASTGVKQDPAHWVA